EIAGNQEGQRPRGGRSGRDNDDSPSRTEEKPSAERQDDGRHEEDGGDDVDGRIEKHWERAHAPDPDLKSSEPLLQRKEPRGDDERGDRGGRPDPLPGDLVALRHVLALRYIHVKSFFANGVSRDFCCWSAAFRAISA